MPINLVPLHRFLERLAALFFALLLVAPVAADPTGRVGRLAWFSGSVHLHRAEGGESTTAMLNWPITSGDIVSTAGGARAEIEIGSTRLQLDASTVLEFAQVDDQRVQLRLLDGSVIARLPSSESAREFDLGTRDGRFRVRDAGRYRFDSDRSTTAGTVYSGNLRFDAADGFVDISAGQRAQFWNTGRTQYQLSAPADDTFALWSSARDRHYASAAPARYVSPEMTGAADLDAHGNWSESPEYGAVWFPRTVAANWVPYRTGRWVWVEPWGWNWVGDEPWGFAPFHYGRWVLYRGAWGWVPGKWVARPVYAPALVGWIGTPGLGARPTVGWFPLAPREVYVPPYRSSANHLRQVNLAHVANITNITEIASNPQAAVERTRYANHRLPQAVTVVPADVVTQRRHVGEAGGGGPDRVLAGSQQVQFRPPVAVQPTPPARRLESDPQADRSRSRREADATPVDNRAGGNGSPRQTPPVAGSASPASAIPQAMPFATPGRTPAAAREVPIPAGGATTPSGARDAGQQSLGRPIPQSILGNPRLPEARSPPVAPGAPAAATAPATFSPGERSERSRTSAERPGLERRESAADPQVPMHAPTAVRQKDRDVVQPWPAPPAPAAQRPERPAGELGRSLPLSGSDRPEQRVLPPPPPVQSPFATPQRTDRAPAAIASSPATARQERPAQRLEAPAQIPQATAVPRSAPPPAPEAVRLPPQPRLERSDGSEQRRQERAPNREDSSRQQVRQEVRVAPTPSTVSPRAPAAPVQSQPAARPERPLHPERPQESGRPHERRADPRDEHRQPVQDKP